MIFSLPCQYKGPDGRLIEVMVDYHIDELRISSELGKRACENRTQRSTELYGAIVAEVRPGSHRQISSE